MKTITPALKTHLAGEVTTLCTCWQITRVDGAIYRFTDFSSNVDYLGNTYLASTGYSPTNVKTTSALNVDNLEVVSVLDSATITDADILNGLWDYAEVEIFMLNWADHTQGTLQLRKGWLGEVKTGRTNFTAELRGLTQPLQQQICRICAPSCNADLGDAKCGINLPAITVTGSVMASVIYPITQDSFTDFSRTETNSTIIIPITGVSHSTPFIMTTGVPHGFTSGEVITIYGITGMEALNGYSVPITYVSSNQFSMPGDTQTFPPYTGGGSATPAIQSEYFQGGKLTWTSGDNEGIEMEVKSFRPTFITLSQPMLYEIFVGDTYELTPGCDKLVSTCNGRFSNVINFQGFPHVPGTDRLLAGS